MPTATVDATPGTLEQQAGSILLRRVALHGLTIDVFGPRILQRTVNLVFSAYPTADSTSLADFEVVAARVPGNRNAWSVTSGDRVQPADFGVSAAARWAEWMVVSMALKHWTGFVHVHAGLVSTPSQCALLIGRSGSGKSTTTVALALEGMLLYSDDVALVDRSTMRPYCVPRPVKLDTNARRRLRPRGLVIPRGARLGESINHMVMPGLPPVTEPGPPVTTAVFFADERQATPRLRQITGAEAVMRLIQQSASETFDALGPSEGAVALVNSVRCYELAAGDLDSTVRTLQELLDQRHMCHPGNG
jgi:hypothetical protein